MDALSPWMRNRRWIVSIYVVIAILLTFPTILNPFSAAVGHPHTTVGCHLWVLWWSGQGLPLHTDLLFYPNGADVLSLYGSDVLSPLLFRWVPWGPVFSYNLWVHFLIVFGAMGMRRLALTLNASHGGAFVAGVVFASAPFYRHEIFNGATELLAAAFLSWQAHFLIQCLSKPSRKNGLMLGLISSLAILASVYNAFFLLILNAVIVTARACRFSGPILTWRIIKAFAWSVLVSVPLLGMFISAHLLRGAERVMRRREDWLDLGEALPDSFASLGSWFDPQSLELPVTMNLQNGTVFSYWTVGVVSLGFVIWALVLTGIRKSGWRGVLLVLAMALAMGPFMRIGTGITMIGEQPIPMPLKTLAYLMPPFSATGLHAYRYAALVIVAVGLIVSQVVKRPFWAVLILMESLLFSPTSYPAPTTNFASSSALSALAEAPEGAVLTAPLKRENLHDLGAAMMAQIIHGKPIQDGGIHHRASPESTQLFLDNPLAFDMAERNGPTLLSVTEAGASFTHLYQLGYRYALVSSNDKPLQSWFEAQLGEPQARDDRWAWWRIPNVD